MRPIAARSACAAIVLVLACPTVASAQINYFGQNKIHYRDFEWRVLPGEHVDLYHYPEEEALARLALVYAEESFAVLERKFGHAPRRRIPLIVYASFTDFEQTNVLPFVPPEGILGVTEFTKRRVTLPFQGNYAEFRHTLRHEMVHAFQLSLESEVFARHPRTTRPRLPLWWSEGLAEFWSGGEDGRDEMILRELTVTGSLPSLQQLNYIYSGVVYPIGGAIHRWLAREFGDWRVQVLYRDLWKYASFDEAMTAVYGVPFGKLNERFLQDFRQRYFPAVHERRPLALTATKIADIAIKPVAYVNPQDSTTELLYLSPSTGYMNIYRTGWRARRRAEAMVKGERSAEFESFHPFASRMDVRNGIAVFTSKYLERDALFFWDIVRDRVVGRYQFPELVGVLSPSWAPDGSSVVFSGLSISGLSDLYRLRLPNGRLERLTEDHFEDLDPSFSPDGRRIVFASDRTAYGPDGALNLFLLDVATGAVRYLTRGAWRDETPRWAANGRIYFSSDRHGVFDVFSIDEEGYGRQETTTLTGAFDPQWVETENAIVFGGFSDLGFGIFRAPLEPDTADRPMIALNVPATEPAGWEWTELRNSTYTNVTHDSYRRRFSLDFATGDAVVAPGIGSAQGALFLFSDLLSDHLLFLSLTSFQGTGIGNFFENVNGSLFYLNQKRRLNWGAGLFRLRGLFREGDFETIFEETSFGGFGEVRWPFSRFSRLEAQLRLERSDRFDIVGGDVVEPRRVGWLASNLLSVVKDNSLWLETGPIDGQRRNITVGVTNDLSNGRFDSWLIALDQRKYFRIAQRAAYAVRVFGYHADGSRPRRITIGGPWALRGYPRFGNVAGTTAFLVNQEVRFPLSDFLAIGLPVGTLRFPGIHGAVFGDVGGAWNETTAGRGVLGSAGVSFRMPVLYPIVLRLDWGYRFEFGDVDGYSLPPSRSGRRFLDFFFGFNY